MKFLTMIIVFILLNKACFAQKYHVALGANANMILSTNTSFKYQVTSGGAIWVGADFSNLIKHSTFYIRTRVGAQQLRYQQEQSPFEPSVAWYGAAQLIPSFRLKHGRSIGIGTSILLNLVKNDGDYLNRKTLHADGLISLTQSIKKFEVGISAHHGLGPFQIESQGTLLERKQYHRYVALTFGYYF
jgi:hypothetical protein